MCVGGVGVSISSDDTDPLSTVGLTDSSYCMINRLVY